MPLQKNCSLTTDSLKICRAFPRFGYIGQYQDDESGLVYLRARYYDPTS